MRSDKFVVALILVGCASASLAAWIYGPGSVRGPRVDVARVVEVGEQEYGGMAVARFSIGNVGTGTLEVKGNSKSCSCSGLEKESGFGCFVRAEKLEIAAGERAEVIVRFSVTGQPGTEQNTPILIETNDPRAPEIRVALRIARVYGGLIFVPAELALGVVDLNTPIEREVEVYEPAKHVRAIGAPEVSNSAFEVTFHPATAPATPTTNLLHAKLVGKLRIKCKTQAPTSLNGEVRLPLDEPLMAPTHLRVFGTVAPPFEVSPAAVALPLRTSQGELWTSRLLIRSRSQIPFSLTVLECPAGYTCTVLAPATEGHRIEVKLDPASLQTGEKRTRQLRLLARSDTVEWPLTVDLLAPLTGK